MSCKKTSTSSELAEVDRSRCTVCHYHQLTNSYLERVVLSIRNSYLERVVLSIRELH